MRKKENGYEQKWTKVLIMILNIPSNMKCRKVHFFRIPFVEKKILKSFGNFTKYFVLFWKFSIFCSAKFLHFCNFLQNSHVFLFYFSQNSTLFLLPFAKFIFAKFGIQLGQVRLGYYMLGFIIYLIFKRNNIFDFQKKIGSVN